MEALLCFREDHLPQELTVEALPDVISEKQVFENKGKKELHKKIKAMNITNRS